MSSSDESEHTAAVFVFQGLLVYLEIGKRKCESIGGEAVASFRFVIKQKNDLAHIYDQLNYKQCGKMDLE